MGDLAQARQEAQASLEGRRALEDATGSAEALNLLGLIAIDEGETTAAQQHLAEALRLLTEEDHVRRGMVLHNLALAAARRSDWDAARRLYQESLGHQRAAGDRRTEATTLGNLGVIAYETGDYAEAGRLYHESLARWRELGDRHSIGIMLYNLGEVAEAEGDAETAVARYVHAERIFRDLGSAHTAAPAEALRRLAAQSTADEWDALRAAAERLRSEAIVEEPQLEQAADQRAPA